MKSALTPEFPAYSKRITVGAVMLLAFALMAMYFINERADADRAVISISKAFTAAHMAA